LRFRSHDRLDRADPYAIFPIEAAPKMPKVTLRSTIPADLPYVIGEPLPFRIRAITALVDGRVIGIGGIAFPPQGPAIAFAQLAPSPPIRGSVSQDRGATEGIPEARRYPVAFHRAGLMAMGLIRTSGAEQVMATADARSDVAVRWLKRLGFKPAHDQRIEGKLLFIWRRETECVATMPPSFTEAWPPSQLQP
jgi:hypothetical protein